MLNGKELFLLQKEMIDSKVDMAVTEAINRVIEQISGFKTEMHTEFVSVHHEMKVMNKHISSLDNRMVAVETKLGMVSENQREVRTRLIDYAFKAGWLALGVIISYLVIHFHIKF